jgi:NACHT domain
MGQRPGGTMSGHLLRQARHDREPWGPWLFGRWLWGGMRAPFARASRWWRWLRIWSGGVNRTWWWHDRLWLRILKYCTLFLALVFLAWLARAVYVVVNPGESASGWPWGFNPDRWCADRSVECDALTGWATSLLSIALASAVFLILRLSRTRRTYLRDARRQPRDLVPTAGTIIGKVVGRDQLCRVVMEDLRVPRTRRPHVLVGGVGTGKTAVVVRLTELLARRHAVPVPVRLRGATELDFTELAKRQFLHEIDEGMSSGEEGEKTWRRLLRDDRIVVLADGLEEALCEEDAGARPWDRDTQIRTAIREARERGLPLFIASRPHAPLRGMDATIHELEPLSEKDALTYVSHAAAGEDDWRLSWIVEMADVAEAPLYLQITRELNHLDMLDDVVGREDQVLQNATHDQASLRRRLLVTWENALIRGKLHPEVALSRQSREVALDWISALACAGLRDDSIEVGLEEPLGDAIESQLADRALEAVKDAPGRRKLRGMDKRLAAAWGVQLGLVELRGDRVRFEHSVIQAYLGSRLMDDFLTGEYWDEALGSGSAAGSGPGRPRPGRDFLISLVLHSRRPARGQSPHASPPEVCHRLLAAADHHRNDNKALDIYAAVLEIASAPGQPEPPEPAPPGQPPDGDTGAACTSLAEIGGKLRASWASIRSDDLQTLEEAKIRLVRRFGRALRTRGDGSRDPALAPPGELGYVQLYQICCEEDSYRVRLAGAQEIGDGGCAAYHELRGHLAAPGGDEDRQPRAERGSPEGKPDPGSGWRARQVSAWVTPILITSLNPECGHECHDGDPLGESSPVRGWLEHVGPADRDRQPGEGWLPVPDEIALAQGFKYAANRRHGQLHTRPRAWSHLEDKALDMLGHASYWFSEFTLVQALTLWSIPEGNDPPPAPEDTGKPRGDSPRPNPDQTVERWLDIIAGKSGGYRGRNARVVHPFVEAAADLATRALAIRQPGRFLWMDESDVISRVGAGKPGRASPAGRKQRLWIPSSAGWSALDPEAQQLLADVLLLLNLIERGSAPDKISERLRQLSKPERAHELPPCITRDRRPLQPLLATGTSQAQPPGWGCLDGCQFRLCPYPPKGLQHHRTELGEEFCRRQDRLVRFLRLRRRTARWQGMSARRLRVFWSQMAERARSSPG